MDDAENTLNDAATWIDLFGRVVDSQSHGECRCQLPNFSGTYQWAFYPHILAGPITLILGLVLISDRFRLTFPAWHRRLGRVQAILVLFVVAPTGLWMAYRAQAGLVAAIGFAVLALATGLSMSFGWRSAVQRRFADHRCWMCRCYLMLCSTVVLRLITGLAAVMNFQPVWFDPLVAWASWTIPLAIFELSSAFNRHFSHQPTNYLYQ